MLILGDNDGFVGVDNAALSTALLAMPAGWSYGLAVSGQVLLTQGPATSIQAEPVHIAQKAEALTVVCQAYDAAGLQCPGYTGTVTVTSSDPLATLPGPIAFVNGQATFQVTFNTNGAQTLTLTDAANSLALTLNITVRTDQ
jgi:hypothetical protein